MDHSLCTYEGCPYFGKYCRIHKSTKKAGAGGKSVAVRSELDKWFDNKIKNCKWICEECNQPCYSSDATYRRAVQAHLLPKGLFKAVATHELNHICLGVTCGCHQKYDSSWEAASKMKIWPQAKAVIFLLIPILWPEEYRKLPDIIANEYEEMSRGLIAAGELQGRQAYVRKVYLKLKREPTPPTSTK